MCGVDSMKKEKVSILIVNWNGKKWLEKCLGSLRAQTYKNFEVIFVDNASTDDSVEFVEENFPEVKVVQSENNLGFAGGNNLGMKYAKGEYILLLNNDTYVPKDFLEKFIDAFDQLSQASCIQSKIVLMDQPEVFDVCCTFWTHSTFLYYFGHGKSEKDPQYNVAMPCFSAKGASMMIKRDVIDVVGLFDDDFWCYYEETDFCHRLWLSGYECWYNSDTVAYHANGGTSLKFQNDFIQFHNFKNKLASFLKNFQGGTLLWVIPVFFVMNLGLGIFWLLQGKFQNMISLFRAVLWNISHWGDTMKKRRKIRAMRKKSDVEIFRIIRKKPRLSYYYYLLTGLEQYED